ncbi:MAG TPA: hypothetical protein VMG30_00075 [Acidobacteriota bacterium]|nr:hypothetical protein [Acidobacteriota bacterium]
MKNATAIITLLVLAGFAGISGAGSAAPQGAPACDRACLAGFVTQYVNAMVAHKPESLPVAANVKFTEDCKELKLGEGFWKTISKLTNYRRDILDVREGVAVSFLVAEENSSPVLFVVRLKVANKKMSEIETMVVHNQKEGMLFNLQNLQTASKMMTSAPDKAQLNSREDMVKAALTYPAGLKIGSFVKSDSPMAPDAYRFENGQLMAGPGCTFFQGCDNMKTQRIPVLSQITQRVIAVDEELGVVAVRMNFGPGSTFEGSGVLDVWHSFKVYGGQIRAAEAYCKVIPAGTKSGWE